MRHSKYHIHTLGCIGMLLLAGSVYQWSIVPLLAGNAEVKRLDSESENLNRILPSLTAENAQLKRDKEVLQLDNPNPIKQVQDPILEIVSSMLERRSISMDNFSESNNSQSATEVDMRLRGSYQDLLNLVQDLDSNRLPSKILLFEISADSSGAETYTARVQVRFILDIKANLVSLN